VISAKTLIDKVQELPTLPTIYTALTEAMANPRSTINDIANIILSDKASTLKVLKLANSAIYGFSGRIDTVSKAIFYIGSEEIKNLIAAMSIIGMFSNQKKATMPFSIVDMWKHSIAVGIVSRQLAEASGVVNLENYFIAGIVHDIGKVLFYEYADVEYAATYNYAIEHRVHIGEAEREILGISHMVIGEVIAEKWKLPATLRNVIRYHEIGLLNNAPDQLISTVCMGNTIARLMELGYGCDDIVLEPNADLWKTVPVNSNDMSTILQKTIYVYDETVKLLLS
jgi:putative nucleotidyltransferase with HDIG domain